MDARFLHKSEVNFPCMLLGIRLQLSSSLSPACAHVRADMMLPGPMLECMPSRHPSCSLSVISRPPSIGHRIVSYM